MPPASWAAQNDAEISRKAATRLYQRALQLAERRLRVSLASIPAAAKVNRRFEERRGLAEREYRKREKALFAKFREDRGKLNK